MSDGSRLSQDKKEGEKIIALNAIPLFPHEGLDYYLDPAVAKELQKRYLIKSLRDHPYITSAKGLGGVRKLAIFPDVQYHLY